METENKSVVNNEEKNLKPFLSVFIILLIIILGYFLVWRSITAKLKNSVASKFGDNLEYSSISVSGFPFKKVFTIKDVVTKEVSFLPISVNRYEETRVDFIKISGFIFSRDMDVEFGKITISSDISNKDSTYNIQFNETPVISFSTYSNSWLKSFKYSDNGYKILNSKNDAIQVSDKNIIDIDSVKNGDNLDYSLLLDIQGNTTSLNINKNNDLHKYTFKAELSYSYITENGDFNNSILKINDIILKSDNKEVFDIKGEVLRDISDKYSYGNIKIVVYNYKKIMDDFKKDLKQQTKSLTQNAVNKKEEQEYEKLAINTLNAIEKIIRKNKETTKDKGVIELSRLKNKNDYIVNGDSVFNILQNDILGNI